MNRVINDYVSFYLPPATAECPDHKFGLGCMYPCNCRDPDADCWKTNGLCESGCANGYTGDDCHTPTTGQF